MMLTDAKIRGLKSAEVPKRHAVGAYGLYVLIRPNGWRGFVQRITINGRRRDLGLGPFPVVTLDDALETALQNKRAVRKGGGVVETRRAEVSPNLNEIADKYLATHSPKWGAARVTRWTQVLRDHVRPKLGSLPVGSIETGDVVAILKPIEKSSTQREARRMVRALLDYAMGSGLRTDNPAEVKALEAVLPSLERTNGNHDASPVSEVPAIVAALRDAGSKMSAQCARFVILTYFAKWRQQRSNGRTLILPGALQLSGLRIQRRGVNIAYPSRLRR